VIFNLNILGVHQACFSCLRQVATMLLGVDFICMWQQEQEQQQQKETPSPKLNELSYGYEILDAALSYQKNKIASYKPNNLIKGCSLHIFICALVFCRNLRCFKHMQESEQLASGYCHDKLCVRSTPNCMLQSLPRTPAIYRNKWVPPPSGNGRRLHILSI
jgi:hypothetical protein